MVSLTIDLWKVLVFLRFDSNLYAIVTIIQDFHVLQHNFKYPDRVHRFGQLYEMI